MAEDTSIQPTEQRPDRRTSETPPPTEAPGAPAPDRAAMYRALVLWRWTEIQNMINTAGVNVGNMIVDLKKKQTRSDFLNFEEGMTRAMIEFQAALTAMHAGLHDRDQVTEDARNNAKAARQSGGGSLYVPPVKPATEQA